MSDDFSEFLDVFYEECDEALAVMESGLLALDGDTADAEAINTIFRAAHSIKGGAATFDLPRLASFTHVMETLLDEMRDGRRAASRDAVDILLAAVDMLRTMVAATRAGEAFDPAPADALSAALEAMLAGGPAPAPAPPAAATEAEGPGAWRIRFAPGEELFSRGNDPMHVFQSLEGLGALRIAADLSALPAFATLDPTRCHLAFDLELEGAAAEAQVREAFEWISDECELSLTRVGPAAPAGAAPAAPAAGAARAGPEAAAPASRTSPEASSIRVGIDKVDGLINLVGELVITQSMLTSVAEGAAPVDLEKLRDGVAQLERNTRELQEMAMQIRMLPISNSFNRFPRLVRDLSAKLGKQVTLDIEGGSTELDKTVLEKIGDPLVHLVRNSLDHGIEPPDVRRAQGKDAAGRLTLNACHEGGNIVIEVRDDGAGLDAARILFKARERGLVGSDDDLDDEAIHELIFRPGFSTVESVSDLSGRGVGMDVVRRNIQELGGVVSVTSRAGEGSVFTIRLPLTLAILDGQLVRVGRQTYIVSLLSVVESLQVKDGQTNRVAGKTEVFCLRGRYIPVVRLHRIFGVESDSTSLSDGLLVVVEAEGRRIALFVDELLGQQQVVIKSLESNFRHVQGLSGATILGDGRVALILDVPRLIRGELDAGKPLAVVDTAA